MLHQPDIITICSYIISLPYLRLLTGIFSLVCTYGNRDLLILHNAAHLEENGDQLGGEQGIEWWSATVSPREQKHLGQSTAAQTQTVWTRLEARFTAMGHNGRQDVGQDNNRMKAPAYIRYDTWFALENWQASCQFNL